MVWPASVQCHLPPSGRGRTDDRGRGLWWRDGGGAGTRACQPGTSLGDTGHGRGGWEAGWGPWRAHSLRLGVGLGTCEGSLKAKCRAGAWGPRTQSGRGPPRVPAQGTGELSQMWIVEQEHGCPQSRFLLQQQLWGSLRFQLEKHKPLHRSSIYRHVLKAVGPPVFHHFWLCLAQPGFLCLLQNLAFFSLRWRPCNVCIEGL